MNFNSIKVQLKQSPLEPILAESPLFQFHKGTIKTLLIVAKKQRLK